MHLVHCYTRRTVSSLPSIVPGRGADLAGAHEVRPLETGRRDRKKAATRLAIRSAALALAAERGFARVTIEDIAVVADIAPRTFFNYFPSKESAVLGVDPDRARALCSALADRPADEGPLQALRAVLVEHSQSIVDSFQELGGPIDLWFERFSIARQDADLLGAYAARRGTRARHRRGAGGPSRRRSDGRRIPEPRDGRGTVGGPGRDAQLECERRCRLARGDDRDRDRRPRRRVVRSAHLLDTNRSITLARGARC